MSRFYHQNYSSKQLKLNFCGIFVLCNQRVTLTYTKKQLLMYKRFPYHWMIKRVVFITEADELTTCIDRNQVGACTGDAHAVGGEDAVDNRLHDSGEAEEDDGGEYLAEIGADGAPLQCDVLQELRETVVYVYYADL